MICESCGKEIRDGAAFCRYCGKKQLQNSASPTIEKQENHKTSETISEPLKKEIEESKFTEITVNGRFVVYKDGDSTKYYCPNCHTRIAIEATCCANCNANLMTPEKETQKPSEKHDEKSASISAAVSENSAYSAGSSKTTGIVVAFVAILLFFLLISMNTCLTDGTGITTVQSQTTSGWISSDTFSIDTYTREYRTYRLNNGTTKSVYCYHVSSDDLNKLWVSTPKLFVYEKVNWKCYAPEYDDIESYVKGMQSLLREYNVICQPVQYTNNGSGAQFKVFVIRYGKVKAF